MSELTTKAEVIAALQALSDHNLMVIALAANHGIAITNPVFPSRTGLEIGGVITSLVKEVIQTNVVFAGNYYHVVDDTPQKKGE